ncbi:UDP-glucose/GDP-mannose dehydrogenase family protein [Paenibacillus sp. SC116]|uniref:UDP-glucose dehydrogenase family protein n=1 Tax=Paenibacillus sp. SC116 TaxID=2968986 RepID=UPI00215B2D3F|nr:UDP-glucose/GDP-mannose dehydrogenase family protein [Paenibacillus sp. SC116]MCR8844814.1 UDP-glucose/GDP-mannose dehydrogenase family protein [Paenibacillus sp. SC116]
MQIAVIGTGYVGLVTGVCLSEVGHQVTCIDIDINKIKLLKNGQSPIYEPGLQELIQKNTTADRLHFTNDFQEGLSGAKAIYIAVGTPAKRDGTANLEALEQVGIEIAKRISDYTVIITKSTVPIGTNDRLRSLVAEHKQKSASFDVVSNPEFLREGSAIFDTFKGDRIIIGADSDKAAEIVEEINRPFEIPIYRTTIRSAEMIKYASNAFLATKISFINEISNLCEKLNADIEEVAYGMGMDKRIGGQFLKAGIGYGGSCFPKDTNALVQIAGNIEHEFELLKSVIEVNNEQQGLLVKKARIRFGTLKGLRVAVLGLAFKPNTDDIREAASLVVINQLIKEGAHVVAYDPVAINNAKKVLPDQVEYTDSFEGAIQEADCAMILTEWEEVTNQPISSYVTLMKQPIVFDGRNCYHLDEVEQFPVEYHSIGRRSIILNTSEILC